MQEGLKNMIHLNKNLIVQTIINCTLNTKTWKQIQKRNGRKNHSEYHCSRDKVIFYFYERRSGKSPQKEPPSMLGESTNIRFFFRIVAKAKNSQHSVLLPNCCKGKEILRTFNNTINSVEQSNSFAHIQYFFQLSKDTQCPMVCYKSLLDIIASLQDNVIFQQTIADVEWKEEEEDNAIQSNQ